jgi:sugar/nucleoside kinase (ribokinase family)
MAHVLVIGSPSLDILHFNGQTQASAGGAGMYTAMAAQRSGAQVSIFSPCPEPMPDVLQPVAARTQAWLGPIVTPTELPRFEISHQGDEAAYLTFFIGAEADLTPEMLPDDLSRFDCIHIIPLGNARRQHTFLQACRQRGAKCISLGTFIDSIINDPEVVRASMAQSDVFFMNEKEAIKLFGSVDKAATWPGKTLYVTLGGSGAVVVQGDFRTYLPSTAADSLDPTGAGDTFCGATLAHLLLGAHPIIAADRAMPLAAQMTEQVGPTALFWPEPSPDTTLDQRVVINGSRVEQIAQQVAGLSEATPFSFMGPDFPPAGHAGTLDFFFSSVLQQFGFWTAFEGRYHQPLIAPINGRQLKGSAYLFQSYVRCLADDPELFTPQRQANLTQEEMFTLLRADDGSDVMPALDLHLAKAQQYGRDMLALNLTPQEVVRRARNSADPLETFFGLLDHVGGYKEDPLRKKAGLLALILNQRPEAFLTFGEHEQPQPVIDYHLMRSCLRTGLLDVIDEGLRRSLVERRVLQPADEWAVRYAAFRAMEQVAALSGKPVGAVDWFFFGARQRCPEMTEPVCEDCPLDPVCAHRKELFQPVFRTTFY